MENQIETAGNSIKADIKENLMAASNLAPRVWEALADFCSDHLRHYGCYPGHFVYEDDDNRVIFETNEPLDVLSDQDKDFIEADAKEHAIKLAKVEWEKLSAVPADENGLTTESYKQFPAGTDVHDIWHWFEAAFYKVSIAEDLMGIA